MKFKIFGSRLQHLGLHVSELNSFRSSMHSYVREWHDYAFSHIVLGCINLT